MKTITEKNKLIAEFLGKNTPLIDRNDGYTKDLKVFSYLDIEDIFNQSVEFIKWYIANK